MFPHCIKSMVSYKRDTFKSVWWKWCRPGWGIQKWVHSKQQHHGTALEAGHWHFSNGLQRWFAERVDAEMPEHSQWPLGWRNRTRTIHIIPGKNSWERVSAERRDWRTPCLPGNWWWLPKISDTTSRRFRGPAEGATECAVGQTMGRG